MRLTTCLLLAACAAAGSPPGEIPIAVWYGGGKARAPMLEPEPRAKKETWRKDLQQIKSVGFTAIRAWIDWASGEPSEGKYNFDTLDVLAELAREEGLRVIVQVYMDAAPDWLGGKYPDARYVAASGAIIQPESAPGYCVDHPGIRKAQQAFFTALARYLRGRPAFRAWDLWSEPHVINWANPTYLSNPEFCFCPHTVRRYRQWLEKRYGSLEALNKAWYRRFRSWEQVEPNRLSTILSYTDYIDWRTFIQEKLGQDLRDRFDAVKAVAPAVVATSHAASPGLFTSPLNGYGSPDDWIMRGQVDFWGTSFYPKHSFPVGRDPAWRGALLDFARSAGYAGGGPGFWVGELQAGFGTVALNVSGTVTPQDLAIWAWSALARGARGISFYAWYPMSTGYEAGGYGMIQLDGTLTGRARTAGEVARTVSENSELFAKARPVPAQVAIVYNPLVYYVGGRQRAATTFGPQSEVMGIERDSMLGAYRGFFPANVQVDFVHARELTAESLAGYRLVYLPYPLMLARRAAVELASYVKNGGVLVAEARAGWNDEAGRAAEIIPGLGLHEVFGCRETAVQSIPGSRTELVWASDIIPGLKPGDRLPARLYEETLEPLRPDAHVIARFADGRPAAVSATYGRGRAIALGSYVAVARQQQPTEAAGRFFAGLLEWAGVRPEITVDAEVEARALAGPGERLVFLFNHSDQPVSASVNVRGAARAADLVTRRTLGAPPWRAGITANGVRILRVYNEGRE